MAKEELYKSGIVFQNPKDLKTKNCLEESQLDVLKTIPDAVKSLGGFAEFENVKIRGTLSTAVFEKETVNAVGGQLYIANSTTITGSANVGASDTTIQVANASGFAAGEIIVLKNYHL